VERFPAFFIFILYFFVFTTIYLLSPKKLIALVLFEDNFNSDNYDKWEIIGDKGWLINNDGEFGIHVNSSKSNALPKEWDPSWKNFIYKVDLRGVEGTDKNILIKYIDENNFFEIHHHEQHIHLEKKVDGHTIGLTSPAQYPLINGKTYHFEIIVENNKTRVYINNELVFEIIDEGLGYFDKGKIGLRVATGGDPVGEVWYDNVVVCSLNDPCEPSPVHLPVIFVPGLGASINFKEMFLGESNGSGWKITPGTNVYNNIFNAFSENNIEYYPFYYDWRSSIIDNARKLNEFVVTKISNENEKVNLVGHSLGGLVARTCIQQQNGCHAQKLITVGSPHLGVVDVYPAVEGGEIWRKGIVKLALELLTHYYWIPGETKRETLEREAPVLKELLPVFDFLNKDGAFLSWDSLNIQNPLLPQLSDISPLLGITKTIFGTSYITLQGLKVSEPNWLDQILGNWPDGKPVDKIKSFNGDGTVLSSSASLSHPEIESFDFELDHGGIVSDEIALEKIFELLNSEPPNNTYTSLSESKNFLVFLVHSPVTISSLDIAQENQLSEEIIIIPEPQNQEYTLHVEGEKDGYYLLSVGLILGDSAYWNDYFDQSTEGQTSTYVFTIDSQNPNENPLNDPDGHKINSLLQIAIDEFKNEVKDEKIKKNHQKKLLSLLNNILDNSKRIEKSFTYLNLLRKTIAIYEKNDFLTSAFINTARQKAFRIANLLESLSFLNPSETNQRKALGSIAAAENVKKDIEESKNLTKTGALVFLQGQKKLDQAKETYGENSYYRTLIFSQEAKALFLEAKMIK